MPKPVIAAVNGVAAGAGPASPSPATSASLADTAGFNLAFAGVALSCDTGSAGRSRGSSGRARALELLF